MNLIEHHIVKIIEERPLNAQEIIEFSSSEFLKKRLNDFIFVKYEADCYGTPTIVADYYIKENWEIIKKQGYEMK